MAEKHILIKKIGVLRDTARAPQPPNNQPTGHQMNRQGLYGSIFCGKNGRFWTNILIILGGSKSSGTHHLGTSFALFFWSGIAPSGAERPIFCPNFSSLPKTLGFLAQKKSFSHFGANIGLCCPFGAMLDQKNMQTRCQVGFLVCGCQNFGYFVHILAFLAHLVPRPTKNQCE